LRQQTQLNLVRLGVATTRIVTTTRKRLQTTKRFSYVFVKFLINNETIRRIKSFFKNSLRETMKFRYNRTVYSVQKLSILCRNRKFLNLFASFDFYQTSHIFS